MISPPPVDIGPQVRCWCGNAQLEEFSPDYLRCPDCQTLVLRAMKGQEISQVQNDEEDFYGKNYYLHHVQEDYGLPDLESRARVDLPERCLHWLRTTLKYISGPGARTLELGCGHSGFVAMQRWAGLNATGLELSPWLVQQARAWFGAPVLQGRLEDQDLAPESLDAIMMMDVLEHLPDPRQTLGRAISLLRPADSFLLIQTPCYPVGWSYEQLRTADHPFLIQLKPLEHLYLFSEQGVRRLCNELGLAHVRFEPAIFAHYDLFAVASANALPERDLPRQAEMLLNVSPPARSALALLDLGKQRDDLSSKLAHATSENEGLLQSAKNLHGEITRLHGVTADLYPRLNVVENERNLLSAQLVDARRQFEAVQADNAARLSVIEQQGAEMSRLHGEVERWLRQAGELGPQLQVVGNERNLLAAQLDETRRQFERVQADNAARLEVIEQQGAEVSRLHAEVHRWLRQAGELGPRLEEVSNERNLLQAQSAELQRHFESSEADRAARLEFIHAQAAEVGRLQGEVNRTAEHSSQVEAQKAELERQHLALTQSHQELLATHARVHSHWTARMLKKIRLWPT